MSVSVALLVVLTLQLATLSDSARILAVVPYNARSHFIVMEPLLLALQDRGHHVTVVSSFPQKKPLPNLRDIDMTKKLPATISNYTLALVKDKMPHVFQTSLFIMEIHLAVCEQMLGDEQLQTLLNEKFDLFIGEIFGADCFNYFAHKMNIPFINFVTSTALPWMADRVGLPDNPAYVPNYFVEYDPQMSFSERVFNAITLLYSKEAYYFYSERPSHRLAEEAFQESLPPMAEVTRRTSMVFINSHVSLSQSRPFPPNVVEVGGIHIKEPQPLPKDLKDIVDNAKEGVVLMSFGSLVRTSSLPKEVIEMFLSVFGSLSQKVMLKYEDALPNAPSNVIVRKWLPQTDISAHPNVKAIITHCGLASTIEAVHFAKPVVAVPFFSDQFKNARDLIRRGGAVLLDIDNLSKKDVAAALKAVLEDPSYAENMKRLSLQFRDRPMTALQTAVYWTEYVIRHQGAPHLRPASVGLPLYQYLLLDVIALLLFSVVSLLAILYLFIRACCKCICGGTQKKKIKKTKKTN